MKEPSKFSVPKDDRGLLTLPSPKKILPGAEPALYVTEQTALNMKKRNASFSIP